jgi:hypothetical protein
MTKTTSTERIKMPEELYDKEEIETAFFNYDSDGSESQNGEWEKRKEDWAKFWNYIENYKATAPERCGGC